METIILILVSFLVRGLSRAHGKARALENRKRQARLDEKRLAKIIRAKGAKIRGKN